MMRVYGSAHTFEQNSTASSGHGGISQRYGENMTNITYMLTFFSIFITSFKSIKHNGTQMSHISPMWRLELPLCVEASNVRWRWWLVVGLVSWFHINGSKYVQSRLFTFYVLKLLAKGPKEFCTLNQHIQMCFALAEKGNAQCLHTMHN